MVNSDWKSSTSSPVFSGLRDLYFPAPFADTVIVTLCGVKLLHKRSKVMEGTAAAFWPPIAAEFRSLLWAEGVRAACRNVTANSSQRKMTPLRFILKLLDNEC